MENMSRTLEGPTPTNISKNSEPDTVIKGTFASPAVALASRVLPVPGGPTKKRIRRIKFVTRTTINFKHSIVLKCALKLSEDYLIMLVTC